MTTPACCPWPGVSLCQSQGQALPCSSRTGRAPTEEDQRAHACPHRQVHRERPLPPRPKPSRRMKLRPGLGPSDTRKQPGLETTSRTQTSGARAGGSAVPCLPSALAKKGRGGGRGPGRSALGHGPGPHTRRRQGKGLVQGRKPPRARSGPQPERQAAHNTELPAAGEDTGGPPSPASPPPARSDFTHSSAAPLITTRGPASPFPRRTAGEGEGLAARLREAHPHLPRKACVCSVRPRPGQNELLLTRGRRRGRVAPICHPRQARRSGDGAQTRCQLSRARLSSPAPHPVWESKAPDHRVGPSPDCIPQVHLPGSRPGAGRLLGVAGVS